MINFFSSFTEWVKNLTITEWANIATIITATSGLIIFIVKFIIKVFSCPINVAIHSFFTIVNGDIEKYVFKLLIQNKTKKPISISHISLNKNKCLYSDARHDDPITIINKDSLYIIREFLIPCSVELTDSHSFECQINKKNYKFQLFAEAQNAD